MVNRTAESAGYLALVGFLFLVWPPLALLGFGVLLIVWANVRAVRGAGDARTAAAIGAAWASARAAYRQARLADRERAELKAPGPRLVG